MSTEARNTCLYALLLSAYREGSVMERLELQNGHLLVFVTGFELCVHKTLLIGT